MNPYAIQDLQMDTDGVYGLGSFGKQIDWNTTPVINPYPINSDGYWDCNDWMTWHKKVAAKYGVARANEVFVIHWNKQGFWAYANSDCWIFNKQFRDYFKSVGLPLDALADYVAKPFDIASKVLDTSEKVVDSASKVIVNAGDSAVSTSKVLKVLIPVGVTAIVLGAGYFVYKNYLKGNKKIKVAGTELGTITRKSKRKK